MKFFLNIGNLKLFQNMIKIFRTLFNYKENVSKLKTREFKTIES